MIANQLFECSVFMCITCPIAINDANKLIAINVYTRSAIICLCSHSVFIILKPFFLSCNCQFTVYAREIHSIFNRNQIDMEFKLIIKIRPQKRGQKPVANINNINTHLAYIDKPIGLIACYGYICYQIINDL